jgi:hypothetical protein
VNGRIQTHGGDSVSVNLAMQAAMEWPTPNKMDGDGGASKGGMEKHAGGVNLREACNWPTPTKRDEKSIYASDATMKRNARPLSEVAGQAAQANPSTDGKPQGSLNSAWVMQLMGWPEEFAAGLTRHCCEWQETAGVSRSRCSSTDGSSKRKTN